MTNKINGIDVSECAYFNSVTYEEPYCNIDQEHLYTCSSDENCYFKQLKRLEQQIEAYQLSENEAKEIIAELKHKNKELKDKCKKYGKINEQKTICYAELLNKCLGLENKNYKIMTDLMIDKVKKDNYLKALEKIKKWATNHNPCDIKADINCTKKDCFECLNYDIKKITKIIDEVLEDNQNENS